MARIDVNGVIVPNDDAWIYSWFDMEHTAPGDVKNVIDGANGEDLDVYINSGGGDVFAGSEIYSALRAYPGKVNIHVTGLAASAASVIACAGHSDISPTAQMMVHNVSTTSSGNYHDMDKASDMLKQANRAIASAYVAKTGMPEQDALDLMDAETWLTAQDAVDYGLIDEIAQSKNTEPLKLAASASPMIPQEIIDKMNAKKQNLTVYFTEE